MKLRLHVTLEPSEFGEGRDLAAIADSVYRRTGSPLEVTLPGGDVVYLQLRQVEVPNE